MGDPIRELLDSPLDEAQSRRWWLWVVVAGVLVVGVVGYLGLRGSGDASPTAETTVVTSTSTTFVEVGLVPEARSFATLSPLPDTGRLLLVGGSAGQAGHGWIVDMPWAFLQELEEWVPVEADMGPSSRVGHASVYVDSLGGVIVFGGGGSAQLGQCFTSCADGFLGDMWLFDEASNAWEELFPAVGPSPRSGHAMAYDSDADMVILFGGLAAPVGSSRAGTRLDDTWLFDPSATSWRLLDTETAPSPRAFHQMVYDQTSGSVVLWGGRTEDTEGDPTVWRFDAKTSAWTPDVASDGPQPDPRWSHVWVAEPQSGSIVMIGGEWFEQRQRQYGSDVWTYDPATSSWTAKTDLGGPVAWGTAAASGDGTVTVFGSGATGIYNPTTDVWR